MTTHKQLLALALLAGCAGADESLAPGSVEQRAAARGGLSAPAGLAAATLSSTQVALSWQDNATKETGFEIHRSTTGASGTFTLRAVTGAGVTSHTDEPLSPATEYCYKVRAVRAGSGAVLRSAFSAVACATTHRARPPAPNYASALEGVGGTIQVSWSNVFGEDGYRVERSPDGASDWTLAATLAPDVTTWTTALVACFRIVGFNVGGESAPSPVSCTVPAAPSGVSAVAFDADSLLVTWTDNSAIEDSYAVWVGYDYSCASWDFQEFLLAVLPPDSGELRTTFTAAAGPSGCPPMGIGIQAVRNGVASAAAGVGF